MQNYFFIADHFLNLHFFSLSLIGCIKDLNVDQKTKEVEYTVPREVHKFLDLYTNISACLTGNISYNYDVSFMFLNIVMIWG